MRHNTATLAANKNPQGKHSQGRQYSAEGVMQLTLMDEQIASGTLKDSVREAVVKKRASISADVGAVQLVLGDPALMAAMEDALAKKRASIAADVAVHNALVEHMQRLRKINASVAA